MSEQNLLALWKRGTPLAEASANPSEETIRDEYERLRPDVGMNTGQPSGDQPAIGAGLQTVLDVTQSLAYHGAELRAVEQSQQALLDEILAENLIGLGFEPPINTADLPQTIPLHVWPSRADEVDWHNSSFSKDGIEFLKIRVVGSSTIETDPLLPSSKTAEKQPVGRPSRAAEIIEAYKHLRNNGGIDYGAPFSSHYPLIRKTARLLHPELTNDKGLGDEAIRIHAGPLFDRDKPT